MTTVRVFAPAKINLFLHVIGRRPDGYHLIESLVAFADIGDQVSVQSSVGFSVSVAGEQANDLAVGNENSVLRAARFLAATAPPNAEGGAVGVQIALTKNLPVAAGLGGGSSDAAATLLGCQSLWKVARLPPDGELARRLGADVPVCLRRRPTLVSGIGDVLADLPALPPCPLVLVNPRRPIATAAVFGARTGPFSTPQAEPMPRVRTVQELATTLQRRRNDLTDTTVRLVPDVAAALAALTAQHGCLLARMSGSGATCFGLFASATAAHAAAVALTQAHPGWWIRAANLGAFSARI